MTEQNIFAGIFNTAFDGALAALVDTKVAAAVAAKQDGASTNEEAVKLIVFKAIADHTDTFMDTTAGDEVKALIDARSEQRIEDQIQESLDAYDPTEYYGFDNAVQRIIDGTDGDDIDEKIESAIDDYDFDDKISDALSGHDFSEAIETAINDYDMSDMVKEIIREYDMTEKIRDAVDAAVDKALSRLFDSNANESEKLYEAVKRMLKEAINNNL